MHSHHNAQVDKPRKQPQQNRYYFGNRRSEHTSSLEAMLWGHRGPPGKECLGRLAPLQNALPGKSVDNGGFDPPTSRMLSVRSTN